MVRLGEHVHDLKRQRRGVPFQQLTQVAKDLGLTSSLVDTKPRLFGGFHSPFGGCFDRDPSS